MKFLAGVLCGLLIPILAGLVFLFTGGMPVATKGPPLPLEKFVARTAVHVAMKGEEDRPSPVSADEINLMSGAKLYTAHCAVCHGLPEHQATLISMGLFPKPPQLFEADHGVTDDPVGESFWKIKNGIRLTGMPGFVDHLSDTEMWQISQLVTSADKLPSTVQEYLTKFP